jgi:2-oxo-4-hydroxy-4-carboxy-5-ureidoimidazoline decarboxylase
MAQLNQLTNEELTAELKRIGGADAWVHAFVRRAPFRSDDDFLTAADAAFDELSPEDWKVTLGATRARAPEQGDAATVEAVRTALRLYEERFAHPFVAVTSSDTADELLMRVRIRLGNEPDLEWRITREEQRRLVRLRLQRLLATLGAA